jgi:ArsR family transcriptional regulator
MELKETSRIYGALSDETRLRLLFVLSHGEFCVTELTGILGLPQSTVSRHLGVLSHVNLVVDRREGTKVYYTLAAPSGGVQERVLGCVQQVFPGFRVLKEDKERIRAFRNRRSGRNP